MSAPGGSEPNVGTDEDLFAGYRADNPIQTVNGKTFILQGEIWTDTTFQPDTMETEKIAFLSDAYFDLLAERPELGDYFALCEQVIVVIEGVAYEITPE